MAEAEIEFLSAAEYARRYGIHAVTARRMCERGELRCKKIGERWRIADEPPGAAEARESALEARVRSLEEWRDGLLAALGVDLGAA